MTKRRFGSIRKLPSGRWQVRFREPDTNILISAPQTFTSAADADTYLATVQADMIRGGWIDPNAGLVTLATYSQEWLDNRPELALRTRELYQYLLASKVLPHLGSMALSSVSPSRVRSWYGTLASEYPTTAAKSYRLLSTIMKTAVIDGIIMSSPCKITGAGIERTPERPVATLAEIEALGNAMPERLRLVVLLAVWCQLRRGELLGLRRCDIDLMHSTITISQSRTFTMSGKPLTKTPKSNAGLRTIAIPNNITSWLTYHLNHFVGPAPKDFVFIGEKGNPLGLSAITRAWNRARQEVGRTDLHLHDLRHTGLTLAAATGATTAELMHRAGHASPSAALRYQHATTDRDRILADALAELSKPAKVMKMKGSIKAKADAIK